MEKENNMPRGCTSTEAAWWHEPPAACEQRFLAYDGQSCMSAGQDFPVEQGLVPPALCCVQEGAGEKSAQGTEFRGLHLCPGGPCEGSVGRPASSGYVIPLTHLPGDTVLIPLGVGC